MNVAASDDAEHRAAAILRVLATHPGAWRSETAQLLALGMAAKQAGVRAQAVEVFAAAIPAAWTRRPWRRLLPPARPPSF